MKIKINDLLTLSDIIIYLCLSVIFYLIYYVCTGYFNNADVIASAFFACIFKIIINFITMYKQNRANK